MTINLSEVTVCHFMLEFSGLSLSLTHTRTADDGSSCPDMISRQTALSPGLFVCLRLQCPVVCSDSAALNSLRLPVLSSDRQFKASAPSSPLSVWPLRPSHHLPPRVSSLPQRWARSVSLSRIRGISLSHRGRVGQLLLSCPFHLPFSPRSGPLIWPDKDPFHVSRDG